MTAKEIYSDKITKGKHTYFFDINESEQGDLFLKITESKKTENGFEQFRVIVFEENFNDFSEILQKALAKFKNLKEPKQTDGKAYSVEEIRKVHKQAYTPGHQKTTSNLNFCFARVKQ